MIGIFIYKEIEIYSQERHCVQGDRESSVVPMTLCCAGAVYLLPTIYCISISTIADVSGNLEFTNKQTIEKRDNILAGGEETFIVYRERVV